MMMGYESRIRERLSRVYHTVNDVDKHADRIAEGVLLMMDSMMTIGRWSFTSDEEDRLIDAYVRSYTAVNPPHRRGVFGAASYTWEYIRKASEWARR